MNALRHMIDLAQNMNALGPPPGAKELLIDNVEALFSYPKLHDRETCRVVADWIGVQEESVATGNGVTELIYSLPDVLKKQRNIIVSPTFWQYYSTFERFSGRYGTEQFALNEVDFSFDPEKLSTQLQDGPPDAAVYLCNPNNPTSTSVRRDALLSLVERHKEAFFVVDETYLLFNEDYNEQSLAHAAADTKNLAVLTSLSKFYHLPGIRVGAIVSHPDNIGEFLRRKIPYMANPIVPDVLRRLISDREYVNRTRFFYGVQVRKLFALLSETFPGELEVYRPTAIFTLVRLLTGQTSDEICGALSKAGIMVRSGKQLPGLGESWIRMATTHDEHLAKLIETLRQCVTPADSPSQ